MFSSQLTNTYSIHPKTHLIEYTIDQKIFNNQHKFALIVKCQICKSFFNPTNSRNLTLGFFSTNNDLNKIFAAHPECFDTLPQLDNLSSLCQAKNYAKDAMIGEIKQEFSSYEQFAHFILEHKDNIEQEFGECGKEMEEIYDVSANETLKHTGSCVKHREMLEKLRLKK